MERLDEREATQGKTAPESLQFLSLYLKVSCEGHTHTHSHIVQRFYQHITRSHTKVQSRAAQAYPTMPAVINVINVSLLQPPQDLRLPASMWPNPRDKLSYLHNWHGPQAFLI